MPCKATYSPPPSRRPPVRWASSPKMISAWSGQAAGPAGRGEDVGGSTSGRADTPTRSGRAPSTRRGCRPVAGARGGAVRGGRGGRSKGPVRGDGGLGLPSSAAAGVRRRGAGGVGGADERAGVAGVFRVLQARGRGEGAGDGVAAAG